MVPLPKHPLEVAAEWHRRGDTVAIATVMETWGSSPRPPGSQLVVNQAGEFVGSVSAGCVESTVIAQAQKVLAGAPPEVLELGVDNGMAWDVGLSCGGRIAILIEQLDPHSDWLDRLLEARERGEAVVLASDLQNGRQILFTHSEKENGTKKTELETYAALTLEQNECRRASTSDGDFFFHPFGPSPRILVVGAVHIAEPLEVLARLCELQTIVIDPRKAFAERASFEHARVLRRWPVEAFDLLGIDRQTAVVTLSHDPKIDDPALECALREGAFYIGALGSRRTHQSRLERLRERGLSEPDLTRIRGPVGLSIGARSPAEIAVSIIADVVAARRLQSADDSRGSASETITPNNPTAT